MSHTNLRILAVCAALATPVLTSAPASAQQAQVIDASTLARQRQFFDQGNKLYDTGRLAEAEVAYLEAWKLKKSFDVAGNLGNLEADLKRWQKAAEFLSYALREFPAGGKPALRENLLKRQAEAAQHVSQIRVQVNRPGAEIFVDGVSVGVAPLQTDVFAEPGNHLVEARLEGFPTRQENVVVNNGAAADVTVNLVAKGANKGVIVGGIVLTGVAVIAGGALLGIGLSKGSEASSLATKVKASGGCAPFDSAQTGDCATLKSDLSAKSTLGSTGVWLLAGGGVVGVATLIYGLAAGPRASRSAVTVMPVVTAGGGGLFAAGKF